MELWRNERNDHNLDYIIRSPLTWERQALFGTSCAACAACAELAEVSSPK